MNTPGLEFLKVSATGNDFVVVINLDKTSGYDWPKLARILCRRRFSVGADGLVILEKSQKADVRMRIFNSDGSEAEMCGNAARCSVRVLKNSGLVSSNDLRLETLSGIIEAKAEDSNIKIKMPTPKDFLADISVKTGNTSYQGSFINTGVPHAVFFIKDELEKIDLTNVGPKIRYHKQFQPEGTNVNFVQIFNNNSISVRTYERGVEAETYSCGTGAVASAVVGFLKGFIKTHRTKILTKGGKLTVEIEETDGKIKNVFLSSPVEIIYKAKYLGEVKNV
jgi:diaminopimelate epimerase